MGRSARVGLVGSPRWSVRGPSFCPRGHDWTDADRLGRPGGNALMEQGGPPPPSTAVSEALTGYLVRMRGEAQQPWVVFGTYIRSYEFNYLEQEDVAQGMMLVEIGRRRRKISVTMRILGGTQEDRRTGARIVEQTAKVSDFTYCVLHTHFSTYCETIERHIMVYDHFGCRFFDWNPLELGQKAFFQDRYRLNTTWTCKTRELFKLLNHALFKLVTHGGIADRRSYMLSNNTMKLIDVGCNTTHYSESNGIMDLTHFLWFDPFFNDESVDNEWFMLDWLLRSNLVIGFEKGWLQTILGHPMLQLSDHDTLTAWEGVHTSRGYLSEVDAVKLANLLYHHWWPDVYVDDYNLMLASPMENETDEQKLKRACQKHLISFYAEDPIIDGLFTFISKEKPIAYSGELVYLDIINLARNMIHHGARYLKQLKIKKEMVKEMRTHFSRYLSMAYILLHTLKEHQPPTGPYRAAIAYHFRGFHASSSLVSCRGN